MKMFFVVLAAATTAGVRALVPRQRYAFQSARCSLRGGSLKMAAESDEKHFDYLVIGGGSGGVASARRAATYGAKVAVVERGAMGGTCVNVGCVPKKVMWNAAHIAEIVHEAPMYQFSEAAVELDWGALKTARDNYVKRLNGIYERNLLNSGITKIDGLASFSGSSNSVKVGDETYTADHVLIAVGGKPSIPSFEGAEHCITSDGFFELEEMPKTVAVVGAGYIAVEMAGIFNTLGADTSLIVRGEKALRSFDDLISSTLDNEMKRQGLKVVGNTNIGKVVQDDEGRKTIYDEDGKEVGTFDAVLLAIGRVPLVEPLALDKAGVATTEKGYVEVDEYQQTSVDGVYALGDVCGHIELTPMAIAAGRRLSDRLFGKVEGARADYENVPTVVFSHPTIGTIGLTEEQARKKYGDDDITVYTSTFVNLWYGPMPIEPSDKPKTAMKLVCLGPEEKVVGLHVIGMGADEMLQGFGVAMKMGATKADFDSCVAIHPTAAEEFVTLPVWGTRNSEPYSALFSDTKEKATAR